MTEVYLLFYQAILPTFTQTNLLLQRENPNIYLVADAIHSFLKKLLTKFITIQAFKNDKNEEIDITKVDYESPDNHLDESKMTIGLVTKQLSKKLFEDGEISGNEKRKFYTAVKAFYLDSVNQALKKLPFSDSVLNNSIFLNFDKKDECTFDSIKIFCDKYSEVLKFTPTQMDKLQEEFMDYQLLQ